MRSFRSLFLTTALVAVLALSASAGSLNGKELYRNNCKVCHDKASKSGTYTPMTLTQEQWRVFFNSKLAASHKSVLDPKTNKKVLETLTPEQIKAIQRFAIDHAADSEQPATCG